MSENYSYHSEYVQEKYTYTRPAEHSVRSYSPEPAVVVPVQVLPVVRSYSPTPPVVIQHRSPSPPPARVLAYYSRLDEPYVYSIISGGGGSDSSSDTSSTYEPAAAAVAAASEVIVKPVSVLPAKQQQPCRRAKSNNSLSNRPPWVPPGTSSSNHYQQKEMNSRFYNRPMSPLPAQQRPCSCSTTTTTTTTAPIQRSSQPQPDMCDHQNSHARLHDCIMQHKHDMTASDAMRKQARIATDDALTQAKAALSNSSPSADARCYCYCYT